MKTINPHFDTLESERNAWFKDARNAAERYYCYGELIDDYESLFNHKFELRIDQHIFEGHHHVTTNPTSF